VVEGPRIIAGVWPGANRGPDRTGVYSFQPETGYGRPDRFDTVEIRLDARGQDVEVTVTTSKSGHAVDTSRFPLPADQAWTMTLDQQVLVGVLPKKAEWVTFEEDTTTSTEFSSSTGLIDGFDRTVFWEFVGPPGHTDAIIDYVWSDGTQVRSGRSGTLPSAKLRTGGASGTVWLDPATNRAGYYGRADGPVQWSQDRVVAPHPMSSVTMLGNRSASLAVGLLPDGARNVWLDLTTPDGSWQTAPIDGSARLAYLAVANSENGGLVHAIHYTDQHGQHTYKPPR
jgi:hypothetical protein